MIGNNITQGIIEGLAKELGEHITGYDITEMLQRMKIRDESDLSTKWRRLAWVFNDSLQRTGSWEEVFNFIEYFVSPVKFAKEPVKFEYLRKAINMNLLFVGYEYLDTGKFRRVEPVKTLGEAEKRLDVSHTKPADRNTHEQVTKSSQEDPTMLSLRYSPTGGSKRVFITHGKNRSYIQPAEEACRAAGFEPEVAIYAPNVSQTVLQKVSSGINRADVVVVFLTDDDGAGNPSINAAGELHVASAQNKHVILFLEKNVIIPSNLAGLAYYLLEGQWTLHITKELNKYHNR